MKFDWIVDGVLAASPLPKTDADIQSLYDGGVRAILTLTETPITEQRRVSADVGERLGMTLKHIAIDDFHAPTTEQAEEAVAFIDKMAAEGKPVLVHCYAGQGRTGCVLHAYYLLKGYSLPDAEYEVVLKRAICDFNGLSAVQKTFIEDFSQGRTINI